MGIMGCEEDNEDIALKEVNKVISELTCPITSLSKGKKNDIVGKWRLIQTAQRIDVGAPIDTIDVSCIGVIFEFKNNNVLKITGSSTLFKEGVYKYTYYVPEKPNSLSHPGPNLEINDRSWRLFCTVNQYRMYILQQYRNSMVTEYFIRIK